MRIEELTQPNQNFIEEIRGQMDSQVASLFDIVLEKLGKPGIEEAKKLKFLQCLQDNGVENWNGYQRSLDDMEEEEEDEEDEDEDEDDFGC